MLLSMDTNLLPSVRFIGYVSYNKPWIHFRRKIREYIIYIIKKGKLFIQEGSQKYELKSGDFFILQPDIEHKGFKESCCDYYYIHFSHPMIFEIKQNSQETVKEIINNRRNSLTTNCLSEKDPAEPICYIPKHYNMENEEQFIFLLKEALSDFDNRYENYKKLISCKVLEIIIRICREYTTTEIENNKQHFTKSHVKIRDLIHFLNTTYHVKITSGDIEERFESHYDYLNRIFHKITGYTIMNYLNMVRINKAKELIEETPLKFNEIGYLVGVNDPYYFSKLFKKYTGLTPTQYINKIKKRPTS